MARTRSLGSILADVRVRADAVNQTDRWPDPDILERINQSYAQLWSEVVAARGQEHYAKTADITTAPGTAQYTLATDFWEMLAVKWVIGTELVDLYPFNLNEIVGQPQDFFPASEIPRYRIFGTNASDLTLLQLDPIPTATNTVRTYYVPHATRYATDGSANAQLINGFNGYEMYLVYDVAAQLVGEEDRDPTYLLSQLARVQAQIKAHAPHRDAGKPEYVQDVRFARRLYSWGSW